MSSPLVSILVPCHNAAPWLAETIGSALSQTWTHTEIIVVDDGSTDDSLAIAQAFRSPKLKVIAQPNLGASAARNRALREAQGDFIQYLDADDLLAPDKIERQLQQFEGATPDYVMSGAWARFYQHYWEASFTPEPLWRDLEPVEWLVCAWEGNWMMHPAAWLVPRSIAQQAGEWDERLSLNDDGEYFCRVVLASRTVKFCPEARSFYRSGLGNSLSGTKSDAAWQSAFLSLMLETQNLLKREESPRTRHACAALFQRFVYEIYPAQPDLRREAEQKIQQWGGSDLPPSGGRLFQLLSGCLGWRSAKNLQNFFYRYGYRQLGLNWRLHQQNTLLLKELNRT